MDKILIIFFLFLSAKINAQQTGASESISCDFLRNVQYKNGVDTVLVRAVFKDAAKMVPGGVVLKTLDKEKKIKGKYFTYQIGFQPENCSNTYFAPSSVKKNKLIFGNPSIIDKWVYVKCIAFERPEWEYNGVPFFVVIDVTIANH